MPPTFATTGEELGEARGLKPTQRRGEGLVCSCPRVSGTGWSFRKQAGYLRYTSPKASGGEDVDSEEPVSCGDCSSLHWEVDQQYPAFSHCPVGRARPSLPRRRPRCTSGAGVPLHTPP